jgi:hypothetical protein
LAALRSYPVLHQAAGAPTSLGLPTSVKQSGYSAFTKSFPINDLWGWSMTKCEGNLLASRRDPGGDHAPKPRISRRSLPNAGRGALLLATPAFLLERSASAGCGERPYGP